MTRRPKRRKARRTKNDNLKTFFIGGDYQLCTPHWEDGTLEVLKDIAEKRKTEVIVNQNFLDDEEDNDGKRRMSQTLPRNIRKNGPEKKAIENLWKNCDAVATSINREWTTFGMVVLRSEAGCGMQAVHEDGVSGQPEIGGLLIAVQEGTKLYIKGRLQELRVGEVLAFSGSTPHCGADYSELNVRFHAYIAEKAEHIPIDAVGKRQFMCAHCTASFDKQKGLKGHICDGRPRSEVEAIRRGNRERQQRFRDRKKLLKKQSADGISNPIVEEN
eukprot:scaffold1203_cov117-Cylindrotheca_fusiformis.AAC.20